MSIETVFYVVGLILACLALIVSFAGLNLKGFPSRGAVAGVLAVFIALVVATSGLAVAVARHEQDQRHAEQADAAKLTEESPEPTPAGE